MTFQEIKASVTGLTGVVDLLQLGAAIRTAACEIWDSVDLPNTLQEVRVQTNAERYVTFPWQVYKPRGVKLANSRIRMELNTIHPYYHELDHYQSDYECRVLGYVPLQEKIVNASTLVFKTRKILTADVTITVTGRVDYASYVVEPVVLTANSRQVETAERYVNIPRSIVKNIRTTADIDIIDASGNVLGTFPNHLLESKYILAQMYDRCTHLSSPFVGVFDVLFKPHPPQLYEDTDTFPDPFAQIVIFKAIEQLYLRDSELVEVASTYNEKAAELLKQFTDDDTRGKSLRQNITFDRLTTVYAGRL